VEDHPVADVGDGRDQDHTLRELRGSRPGRRSAPWTGARTRTAARSPARFLEPGVAVRVAWDTWRYGRPRQWPRSAPWYNRSQHCVRTAPGLTPDLVPAAMRGALSQCPSVQTSAYW